MRPTASQRSTGTRHNDHGVPDLRRRTWAHRKCNPCGFPIAVARGLAVALANANGCANAETRPHADPFGNRRFDVCSHCHSLTDTSTHA